ncbi:hypothetical protein AGMMS49545_20070 [Betaproteobacteria bacterium]|nr:hypothetical protein AGMMS49545_20070 [Betaproteobacteria bacterium]GHU47775.1 hypothetical protein AGMMS50289_23470 [Betaproteobacteria bacterium]
MYHAKRNLDALLTEEIDMPEPTAQMETKKVDAEGMLTNVRVIKKRYSGIEHGTLTLEGINAIVIHQTDSSTANSTFSSYKDSPRGIGAHFLISETGVVYQTASVEFIK